MIVFSIATIFMNRPSTGTIIKHSLQDERIEQHAKTNTMTAKHFSLEYDASLDTVSDISQQDTSALEVYRVARSDTSGRRIFVITIKPLPAGGMSEESSYKLRHTNPGMYHEGAKTAGNNSFVIFEKSDGSELTAFAAYDGKLAMLAYTLQAPEGSLHEEAEALLRNFHWRE